ncbi:MAG: hypothetical protein AAGJ70_06680, partial [Pseudomonadota bacterium]
MDGAAGQLDRETRASDHQTSAHALTEITAGTSLGLSDLYLLATFSCSSSGPAKAGADTKATGADLASLTTLVSALLGTPKFVAEHGTTAARQTHISDWQLSAVEQGLLQVAGSRASVIHADPALAITAQGNAALADAFGKTFLTAIERKPAAATLERLLVARALGLPASAGATRLKRLDTAPGLRAAVVRRGWKLRLPESAPGSHIRNALAARALGSAFGRALERQIGPNNRLSAKAGRAIAAQLLETRRHIASDARLMTALAA